MSEQSLTECAIGQKVRLVAVDGGRELVRRLLSLGVVVGSELEVLHRRGRSVVVARAGNRVALGKGVAERLRAEVLD